MHKSFMLRLKWPLITLLLLITLAAGCGDNKTTNPTPNPAPSPVLSMLLHGDGGLLALKVHNTGGAMTASTPFVADYADGYVDTVMVSLDKDDSLVCHLSNIHGAVTVTNEDFNLTANEEDCLCRYFQQELGQIKLADYVPSPLIVSDLVICTYTTNLYNLAAKTVTVEMLKRDGGLTLKYVFHDISGHLTSTAPGLLCPDLSGSVTMTSLEITTNIDITTGENPEVTLGTTQAAVYGLSVNADGTFGFIVSYLVQWFNDNFARGIESDIETAISNAVPSDLSHLVIVKSSCSN